MNKFGTMNIYVGKMLTGIILILLFVPMYSNPLSSMMTLTEHNSGSVVLVKRGQVFEIVLTANPTTGYQWETVSLDTEILKQNATRFIQKGNKFGSGGVTMFRFEALMKGKTNLKIGYFRPFEKNKKFERLFQVVIKVCP